MHRAAALIGADHLQRYRRRHRRPLAASEWVAPPRLCYFRYENTFNSVSRIEFDRVNFRENSVSVFDFGALRLSDPDRDSR